MRASLEMFSMLDTVIYFCLVIFVLVLTTFILLIKTREEVMGLIEDKIAEIKAAIAEEKVEVSGKIVALEAKIQELIDAQGGDSPELVAALEEIKVGVQGIFTV